MPLTKHEINRKLLHLLALLMPVGIFYLPKLPWAFDLLPATILSLMLIGSMLLERLRFKYPAIQKIYFRLFSSMLREEEKKKTTGSTYIIGGAFACSLLFYNAPHISFMSLSMFILGDALAAIVGQSIGRVKIGKKTLEGSLACFSLCLIMFFFFFPYVPLLLDAWGGRIPLPLIFIASLSVTLFELVPLKITKNISINDNLSVPVITGLVMQFTYHLKFLLS